MVQLWGISEQNFEAILNESHVPYWILAAKGMIYDNCMVYGAWREVWGTYPRTFWRCTVQIVQFWGISEQNFQAILARSGAVLCPSRGTLPYILVIPCEKITKMACFTRPCSCFVISSHLDVLPSMCKIKQ